MTCHREVCVLRAAWCLTVSAGVTLVVGCGDRSSTVSLAEMNVPLPPVPLVFVPPTDDAWGVRASRDYTFQQDSLTVPEGWFAGVNANGNFVSSAPSKDVVGQCILSSTPLPISVDTTGQEVMAHFNDRYGFTTPATDVGLTVVFVGSGIVNAYPTFTVDSEAVVGQMVNGSPAGADVRIRQVYRTSHARLRVLSCLGSAQDWSRFEPLVDEVVASWRHDVSE